MRSSIQALLVAVSLAGAPTLLAIPETASAQDMKVPETVADHQALAKQYADKALAAKAEAQHHRDMAAAYKKSAASLPKLGPNPWVVKMERHCKALEKDAEKMAADLQKAADYHALRAKELEGK